MTDTAPARAPRPQLSRFTPLPCIHLGAPTGETRPCPTCTGTILAPIYECDQYGECSPDKQPGRVQCCLICKRRVAVGSPPAPAPCGCGPGG